MKTKQTSASLLANDFIRSIRERDEQERLLTVKYEQIIDDTHSYYLRKLNLIAGLLVVTLITCSLVALT